MNWIKINYQYGNALININAIDAITINEHACIERYCKNNDEFIDCDECQYSSYMVNILVKGRNIPIKTDSMENAENLRDSILQQIESFIEKVE